MILALLLSVASLLACVGGQGNATSPAATNGSNRGMGNSNSAKTNVEELGLLVKVPYATEDIVWKEYPTSKKVIAILRFSSADANKIVAEAGGIPERTGIAVESWFPEELIAQTEMSGDNALKGVSYPATAFYQEPYTIGKITRVDGSDYFILELIAR